MESTESKQQGKLEQKKDGAICNWVGTKICLAWAEYETKNQKERKTWGQSNRCLMMYRLHFFDKQYVNLRKFAEITLACTYCKAARVQHQIQVCKPIVFSCGHPPAIRSVRTMKNIGRITFKTVNWSASLYFDAGRVHAPFAQIRTKISSI